MHLDARFVGRVLRRRPTITNSLSDDADADLGCDARVLPRGVVAEVELIAVGLVRQPHARAGKAADSGRGLPDRPDRTPAASWALVAWSCPYASDAAVKACPVWHR